MSATTFRFYRPEATLEAQVALFALDNPVSGETDRTAFRTTIPLVIAPPSVLPPSFLHIVTPIPIQQVITTPVPIQQPVVTSVTQPITLPITLTTFRGIEAPKAPFVPFLRWPGQAGGGGGGGGGSPYGLFIPGGLNVTQIAEEAPKIITASFAGIFSDVMKALDGMLKGKTFAVPNLMIVLVGMGVGVYYDAVRKPPIGTLGILLFLTGVYVLVGYWRFLM